MLIFNIPGLIFLALGAGAAFGLQHLTGTTGEGPWMVIAGPIIACADLFYRIKLGGKHLFHPRCGGHAFFIPIWVMGALWVMIGLGYTVISK